LVQNQDNVSEWGDVSILRTVVSLTQRNL